MITSGSTRSDSAVAGTLDGLLEADRGRCVLQGALRSTRPVCADVRRAQADWTEIERIAGKSCGFSSAEVLETVLYQALEEAMRSCSTEDRFKEACLCHRSTSPPACKGRRLCGAIRQPIALGAQPPPDRNGPRPRCAFISSLSTAEAACPGPHPFHRPSNRYQRSDRQGDEPLSRQVDLRARCASRGTTHANVLRFQRTVQCRRQRNPHPCARWMGPYEARVGRYRMGTCPPARTIHAGGPGRRGL